jgi:hypothetical protein
MTCSDFQERIGEYTDGVLDRTSSEALDAHLQTCAACRAMAEDFRDIRLAALGLEKQAPPPRVWAKLSERLDAERRRPRWMRTAGRSLDFAWGRPLAVAATLLLIVGGSSWVLWQQLPQRQPAQVATQPATAAEADLVQSVETELKLAEEHYEKAISGLEQITRSEGSALDPQVASVLQKNLSVIDQAIGESRAALRAQPASDVAQESLFEALRSKVSLLQETVVLINEMRKGNQEGAARIVSGLNQ